MESLKKPFRPSNGFALFSLSERAAEREKHFPFDWWERDCLPKRPTSTRTIAAQRMSSFVLGGTGPKKKKKKYLVEKMLGTAYGIQRESKGLRGYRGRSILMLFFLHIHRMRRGKEDEEEEEEINMRESDTGARSDFLESPRRYVNVNTT